MPPQFTDGVFARNEFPWHTQGTVLSSEALSFDEVIQEVPILGMNIRLCPIWVDFEDGTGVRYPDRFATTREDKAVLGFVGSGYHVVQPREGFSFLQEMIEAGEAFVDCAVVLDDGAVIAITALAPDIHYVGGSREEGTRGYVNWVDSYNGRFKMTACFGDIRMVCMNTVRAGLRNARSSFEFKHTESIQYRIQEARYALGLAKDWWTEWHRLSDQLITTPFSDKQFTGVLDALVPLPSLTKIDYDAKADRRREENAEQRRDLLTNLWHNSPNIQNIKGTAYGAVNATTEYQDYFREFRGGNAANNQAKALIFDTDWKTLAINTVRMLAEV